MTRNDLTHERFVAAILEHGSIRAASEACGISPTTGKRLMQKPEVRQALDEARRDAVRVALSRLHEAMAEAVDCLVRNLGPDQPASVQVRAASVLVDAVLKSTELLDLDARISALEAQRQSPPRPVVVSPPVHPQSYLPDYERKRDD